MPAEDWLTVEYEERLRLLANLGRQGGAQTEKYWRAFQQVAIDTNRTVVELVEELASIASRSPLEEIRIDAKKALAAAASH